LKSSHGVWITIEKCRAIFSGFLFRNEVDFTEALFKGRINFGGAKFFGDVIYRDATFSDYVNFFQAQFLAHAYFGSAKFSRLISFHKAAISSDAEFTKTIFSGTAFFHEATFSHSANFDNAMFLRRAIFSKAKFLDDTNFQNAMFSSNANFIDAKFSGPTLFAGAHFQTCAPDFRGAILHEATEWHGVSWPVMHEGCRSHGLRVPPQPIDKKAAQAELYAYERLKQEMERLKKHKDEQLFFCKELRAQRALEPRGSWEWWLNYAYESTSGYGQSIYLPLKWLVILFVVGAGANAASQAFIDGKPEDYWLAVRASVASIVSFLPITREVLKDLSPVAQIVSITESLLSIVLLFLLGLALRNRFRMK
jgi:hypothetical protein